MVDARDALLPTYSPPTPSPFTKHQWLSLSASDLPTSALRNAAKTQRGMGNA